MHQFLDFRRPGESDSQGNFRVLPDLSGRVRIECPCPVIVIEQQVAIAMARAILEVAGVEVVFADPGQTVVRGNGNGKVLR